MSKINLTNIKTVSVKLENILLDPNNFRFSTEHSIKESEISNEAIQEETLCIDE